MENQLRNPARFIPDKGDFGFEIRKEELVFRFRQRFIFRLAGCLRHEAIAFSGKGQSEIRIQCVLAPKLAIFRRVRRRHSLLEEDSLARHIRWQWLEQFYQLVVHHYRRGHDDNALSEFTVGITGCTENPRWRPPWELTFQGS